MTEAKRVLVAGATGNQGGALSRELLARGHHVRALTRSPGGERAATLREAGAEIVPGVIQEFEVESLAEWERMRAEMFASPEFQQRQASGEPPFVGGHMEFWTIEATYGE